MSITPGEIDLNRASVTGKFPHVCRTLRQPIVGEDPYEDTIYGPWATHLAELPCQLWERTRRELTDDRRVVLVREKGMLVAVGADVVAEDIVDDVYNQKNEKINDNPMRIVEIVYRSTNWLLRLENTSLVDR